MTVDNDGTIKADWFYGETLIKSTRKSRVSDSQIPNTCPGVRMGDRCDINEDQCCSRGLLWVGL